MNRKNKSKQGFTLVELMVVAIIVAILAAVAIPLMTGNKNRAMATEAQAGLGTVRTALQVYRAEFGGYPAVGAVNVTNAGLSVKSGDLDGKYFRTAQYAFSTATASNYTLTVTGYTNGAENITITLNDAGTFTGVP
jgi:type IV pilus assembly protein PilA